MPSRTSVFTTRIVALMIGIIAITIGVDYYFNLRTTHSSYENALVIVGVFAFLLFVLMAIGLYFGVKQKDDIGKLTETINFKKLPDIGSGSSDISTVFEGIKGFSEGFGEFVFALLGAFVLLLFAWFFILVSWFLLVLVAAMFYWVFYRALRLVLKYASYCRGDIIKSLGYSAFYTFLYTAWMYGIIFGTHFLVQ